MRYWLLVSVAFFAFGFAHGQNLKVIDSESKILGTIGREISNNILIKNTSEKTIRVKVKRVANNINSGQSSYFCVGRTCFEETVDEIPGVRILEPGMVLEDFRSVLKAGLTESQSTITYCFYNADNPSDSVCQEVTYLVEDSNLRGLLFYNDDIRISEVYPNPIDDIALFDYDLINQNSKAKLIIHDVLGTVVGEYPLFGYENSLKISTQHFTPGVYFYTLHIDNNNLITKKMVVRR